MGDDANHLHGIIVINHNENDGVDPGGSRTAPTRLKPLGGLIGAFKTVSTKHINELRKTPGLPLWQRNYYEHIIRTPQEMDEKRNYIFENPMRWLSDEDFRA